MRKRKVLALTAIRSEYFLQRPVLRAIHEHPDLELELIVAGAHLTPLHGGTVSDVEADGFNIVSRIDSLLFSNRDAGRIKSAANELQQLTHVVDQRRPDWLLAAGDREDPMMLALCGAYMNVATAHYGAGDRVVGNIDDMVRHAISRLSHLMFTISEQSRERLIRAGEEEWRVHTVGHAGIDRIRQTPELSREELAKMLGVERVADEYVVVVQHPLSSQIENSAPHMNETLAAVTEEGLQVFVSYPNSDAGHMDVVRVIDQYRERGNVHVFRNIPDTAFVNLLRNATALVGNSSMGVFEAPFLKLPAINVGDRQSQREHAENLTFVPAKRDAIRDKLHELLRTGMRDRVRQCSNPFGDGRSGERVADLLASTPIDRRLLNKDITY